MKLETMASTALLLCAFAPGCGSAPSGSASPADEGTADLKPASDSVPPESAAAAARAEPKYSVTHVTVSAAGAKVTSVTRVTTDEMIQGRNALRAAKLTALAARAPGGTAGGVTADNTVRNPNGGCDYDDVALADSYDGYGNLICFEGQSASNALASAVYLYKYADPDSNGYWDGSVKSYWGSLGDVWHDPSRGDQGEDGFLTGWRYPSGYCYEYFTSTADGFTNAGSCGQIAFALTLTD